MGSRDRILKLEASAGSGKTYRLTREYLTRLFTAYACVADKTSLTGRDPKFERGLLGSILAITFTNKAAQEMKDRILKYLKVFALAGESGPGDKSDRVFLGELADESGLSPERILSLSRDLINLILSSYDDFNVMTIDALMSAMVKAVSPELELPADYEIRIDAGEEMTSRGRAMLACLADDDWPRMERFLEDFRRLNASASWKMDEAIVGNTIALFRKSLQKKPPVEPPSSADLRRDMDAGWKRFREKLQPLLEVMGEEPQKNGKCGFLKGNMVTEGLWGSLHQAAAERRGFPGLAALIKSTFFRREEPGDLLTTKADPEYRKRFVEAYAEALEAFRGMIRLYSAFRTIPHREFLAAFDAAWKEGKQTLFVEEFSRTLAGLFEAWAENAFPYLYLKMSDEFRHFLFDEFQDTALLQFAALAPLIDERFSRRDAAASLFLVGDRKQAIYRWRGGDSDLMNEPVLLENVPAILRLLEDSEEKGFSEALDKNWRSRGEIIAFNNSFWDPGNISRIAFGEKLQAAIRDNFEKAHQRLPPGTDAARQGGYVEVSFHVEEKESREEENGAEPENSRDDEGGDLSAAHLEGIREIVERLHDRSGYAYSDIAVLVRKNTQVRDIVRHFSGRTKKIDTISDQSLMLDSHPRVGEILAFFRFLDYPPDDLAFYAFVGGEIFRKAAVALFPDEMRAVSEDLFIGAPGPFYKLFQMRFPAAWKGLIEPFFQSVGFLPPYDLFCDFTQVFCLFDNFPEDTPFFLTLGDALHQAERDGFSSISSFLLHWKKLMENEDTPSVTIPENAPGVRVLTMHQSKGLEFPAVIVPVNDRAGARDGNLFWEREGLFYINGGLALIDPRLKEIYEEESVRNTLDGLNLLYVAFTRAKEALFVPVMVKKEPKLPEKDGKDGLVRKIARASDVLWRHPLMDWRGKDDPKPYTHGSLAQKTKEDSPAKPEVAVPSKTVLTRSWQSRYLVFRKSEVLSPDDRAGADRGERIHSLLTRLGEIRDPAETAVRVRALAENEGWPESDTAAVVSFLARDDVFRLLGCGREFYFEKDVAFVSGNLPTFLRLDRLQVGPEEILIVEYKTGKEKKGEYGVQLREYASAVRPLFPGKTCRAFLLYLDRGEVEEVPCSS